VCEKIEVVREKVGRKMEVKRKEGEMQ